MKTALTIAGSDPSGGAGIQADLKTFQHFGVYGMAAVSLLTVQNTLGVQEVMMIPPEKIKAQIRAVLEDIRPDVIKLGALGPGPVLFAVAEALHGYDGPVVADPVMLSKNRVIFLEEGALDAYRQKIFPAVFLLTPNLEEAEIFSGIRIKAVADMENAAEKIHALGVRHVLIKGGHLPEGNDAVDLLFDGTDYEVFSAERIETKHTHGIGCTLASAVAARLAQGDTIYAAVDSAKKYISAAIQTAPELGRGQGPVNHFASPEESA